MQSGTALYPEERLDHLAGLGKSLLWLPQVIRVDGNWDLTKISIECLYGKASRVSS